MQAIESYVEDEKIEDMNIAVKMDSEFESAIENTIDLGQNNVAIALAGVCFEQMTNRFYYDLLLSKYEFSKREYESCMKCIPVKDKLGWLYKLTTSKCMDPNIISEVHKVCSLRNNIVHYKPKMQRMGDWKPEENGEDTEYDVSKILPLIGRLEDIFDGTMEELFPEEKIAKDMFREVFETKE